MLLRRYFARFCCIFQFETYRGLWRDMSSGDCDHAFSIRLACGSGRTVFLCIYGTVSEFFLNRPLSPVGFDTKLDRHSVSACAVSGWKNLTRKMKFD